MSAKNKATGAVRTVRSVESGHYNVVGLPPGSCELAVEAQGFARFGNTAPVLIIGQEGESNVNLEIKAAAVVAVTEAAELIETRRMDASTSASSSSASD